MDFHLSHLPAVQSAINLANTCSTMEELHDAIMAFKDHPLCLSTPMPARAGEACPATAPVMLLGKSPAWTENETKIPFSGPAGQVLRTEMQAIGRDVEECWISCASPWKAKKNTPNATLLAIARPFLMREIELVQPRIIIALGQKADEALSQTSSKVSERVGQIWTLTTPQGHKVPVITNWCHAAVMYDPRLAPEFRQTLSAAMAKNEQNAIAA